MNVKLIKLTKKYENQLGEMIEEWIVKNGGVLENEITGEDGTVEQRYWIES